MENIYLQGAEQVKPNKNMQKSAIDYSKIPDKLAEIHQLETTEWLDSDNARIGVIE